MARSAAPVLPLTSLTQSGARAACTACGSDRVTRIAMTLTDGSPVDFAHCQACESRTWEQDGRELTLPNVLTKARKPR
jgi:formate dehydrogenase maturation protein FdhE